ncbi:MAG: efflux RND transporter periplasmic adaptor subunit [Atopobiaceae bacterium]|nr:efflux RND transporter periplasmic adaptor subunit [Atopobiaceae bacterium]
MADDTLNTNEVDTAAVVETEEQTAVAPLPIRGPFLQEDSKKDSEALAAFDALRKQREKKRRRRFIVSGVLIALALVGLIAAVNHFMQQDAAIDAVQEYVPTGMVTFGTYETSVSSSGSTEPAASTVVTPEVDGIIETVNVAEGSVVAQGDILFTLRNESLDKAIRDAQSQLDNAQYALDIAYRNADAARANYSNEWNRANDAEDWSEFDEAGLNSAVEAADREIVSAQDAYNVAYEALTEAQAQAEKRNVRAPSAGSIVALNAVVGAGVGSQASTSNPTSGPLVQIADLSHMNVTVQVNEIDISSIHEGQEAEASFSALPGVTLPAQVVHIASVASGASGGAEFSGGVVTYAVDLVIPNPDPALKPGMTASVTIKTNSIPDCLMVPTSSLVDDGTGLMHVSVVRDPEADDMMSSVEDVVVQLLARGNTESAVRGELSDGDVVLLSGSSDSEVEAMTDTMVAM